MKLLNVIFGVASLVSLLYALWPNLFGAGNSSPLNAWLFFGLCVFLTVGIYIYTIKNEQPDTSNAQSGLVKISERNGRHHEVFYPKQYVSPPNLTVDLATGLGARIELIEQRTDGFVFTASNISWSGSEGASVKWEANGALAAYNTALQRTNR
jgi:hypothetical protein